MPKQTEKHDEKTLRIFHDDFRRALLMHRKGRLRFFSKLLFPHEHSPLDSEIPILEQLDFRAWLENQPPAQELQYQLYLELTRQQDDLLLFAKKAL